MSLRGELIPRGTKLIYAWIGALLIGLSLGLLGSGGSILTVPILVYLVGHVEKQAVAESFAIVGAIALFGGVRSLIAGKVDTRSVLYWAAPGIVGAAVGVQLSHLISGALQILILGFVMLAAAVTMLRGTRGEAASESVEVKPKPLLVIVSGLGIGIVTGLVGIGGGFLIVPALLLLTGTPMHRAVGTSLCIIFINSATGLVKYFLSEKGRALGVDWETIAVFSGLGIAGSFAGALIGKRMNQRALKRLFAVFVLALGVFVIWKQVGKMGEGDAMGAPPAAARP